jgi:hypothetical protein
MSELLIKRNDVVSVLNYNTQPYRYQCYIGIVLGIILPGGVETSEYKFEYLASDLYSPTHIKIQPQYKMNSKDNIFEGKVPTRILEDLVYMESPYNVSIFTPEDYEELRIKFLTKLNTLSNLLYGVDEFRIERLVDKPKPFNINR